MAITQAVDLVGMVINELSQVPGAATQKYSSPIIMQYIQNAYLMEIEDVWWPQCMAAFSVAIDPSNGKLASDLTTGGRSITEFGDIRVVYGPRGGRALPQLPFNVDPTPLLVPAAPGATLGQPIYINPDYAIPNRPVSVLPYASTGPITVIGRFRETLPFGNSTSIILDPLLLMYDAAWMYCVNDGTLPAQVAKYELLIRKRRQQMISAFNNQPLLLDSRLIQASNEWTEQPF